jgi:hypothetical protein
MSDFDAKNYDVSGALAEGYTKKEIAEHLAKETGYDISGARSAGWSDDHIIGEITGAPYNPTATQEPLRTQSEIPELWQLGGAAIGGAYGIGETGLRGFGGNIVKRVGQEIKRELAHPESMGLGSGVKPPSQGPASSGLKYLRNYAGMDRPGFTGGVPEAASIYQRSKGHGNVSKEVTKRFGPNAKLGIEGYLEDKETAEKARLAAQEAAEKEKAFSVKNYSKDLGRKGAAATHLVGRAATPAIGISQTGYGAANAINRFQEGASPEQKIAGGINTAAGVLGLGSLSNKPLIKYPSTAASAGLNWLADFISGEKKEEQTPKEKSLMQGYAKGRSVVQGGLGLIGKDVPNVTSSSLMQTVKDPRRMDFPGIYERPDLIAERAVKNTAPESPLLKQLFGVTRDDLYEMSKRKGNMPGLIPGAAKNPKGSAAAEAVMTPRNEQRLLDIMSELQTRAPEMYRGMHGWYTMDPMYQRLVQIAGPDEAKRLYDRLNTFGGIESPNMPVPNEFRRASAAHMMAEQGRFPDWQKYGGLSAIEKAAMPDYPADLLTVPGRVGHQRASTSQGKYLETGHHGMDSPKAPPYIQASSVPELGFQTDIPVGDAHWSRGIGLADVRTGKSTAESVSTPEIQQLAPWWREKIAGEMGTESVPAQAILWGGLGPATGVKTAVGAPKLELKAIEIGNAARRLGISPEEARDLILLGKERAGKRAGGLV